MKKITAIAAIIASSAALSACVGPPASHWAKKEQTTCPFTPDTSVKTSVTIAYQAIPNGDLIVRDKNVLEDCMPNAKINWKRFDSGGDVLQGFGSGSVDLGLIGSSLVAKSASKPLNMDLVVPWVYDVIGSAESLVVKDPNIKNIKGMKGKTIAVAFGSTSHYSLLNALKNAGMDPTTDVNLVNLAPDKILSAWQSSQVDGAWVWDPTLTELQQTGHVITSSAQTAQEGAGTYDMAAATRSFAEKNPEFMKVWAQAEDWASKLIANDPNAAADSVSVQLGADASQVKKQFKGYEYPDAAAQASKKYLGGDLGESIIKTAQFLRDQQLIDAVSDSSVYRDMLYPTPAAEAAKADEASASDSASPSASDSSSASDSASSSAPESGASSASSSSAAAAGPGSPSPSEPASAMGSAANVAAASGSTRETVASSLSNSGGH